VGPGRRSDKLVRIAGSSAPPVTDLLSTLQELEYFAAGFVLVTGPLDLTTAACA